MEIGKTLHTPVLAKEVLSYLRLKEGMVIVDCTVGLGGHAKQILPKIGDSGYLIGIDADKETLVQAQLSLKKTSGRFSLFHSNYADIDLILSEAKINKIDGALLDLGLSSFQMDRAERGFSIKLDGPLDMRMDRTAGIRASDIINTYAAAELAAIFREYGDEYLARRIAEKIVSERRKRRIDNTTSLAEIIQEALPHKFRFRRIHPATKVFMALRIAVNRETENLRAGLDKIMPFMNTGSRICVISFHSIEDRIVKNKFRELAKLGELDIVTKKPVRPGLEEIDNNPRSRSAKLRVGEKIYRASQKCRLFKLERLS